METWQLRELKPLALREDTESRLERPLSITIQVWIVMFLVIVDVVIERS
jgi:hypothetical protein